MIPSGGQPSYRNYSTDRYNSNGVSFFFPRLFFRLHLTRLLNLSNQICIWIIQTVACEATSIHSRGESGKLSDRAYRYLYPCVSLYEPSLSSHDIITRYLCLSQCISPTLSNSACNVESGTPQHTSTIHTLHLTDDALFGERHGQNKGGNIYVYRPLTYIKKQIRCKIMVQKSRFATG